MPPHLPPLPDGSSRRGLHLQVVGAVLGSVAVISGLSALGRAWSPAMQLVAAAAAFYFVYVPRWLLDREGTPLDRMGLYTHDWKRQIGWALAVGAVVFPLFAAGYHVLSTQWLDREARWQSYPWHSWDEELEGRPPDLLAPAPLRVWAERDILQVFWHAGSDESVVLSLDFDGPPARVWETYLEDGALWFRDPTPRSPTKLSYTEGTQIRVASRGTRGLRIDPGPARNLTVRAVRGSAEIPAAQVQLGRHGVAKSKMTYSASLWWWLWLVAVHLLVVAVPEEVFYRGFVQSRLDQLHPPRFRLFGARIGPGLLYAAVLFGFGHVLIQFDPTRFEVIAPALLFGWLRNRTDSVLAPALVHAGSNVLLEFVSRAYVG